MTDFLTVCVCLETDFFNSVCTFIDKFFESICMTDFFTVCVCLETDFLTVYVCL